MRRSLPGASPICAQRVDKMVRRCKEEESVDGVACARSWLETLNQAGSNSGCDAITGGDTPLSTWISERLPVVLVSSVP